MMKPSEKPQGRTKKKRNQSDKRRKSCAWYFYDKIYDSKKRDGICRLCNRKILCGEENNTTNLLNHLKRKHQAQFQEYNDNLNKGVPFEEAYNDEDSMETFAEADITAMDTTTENVEAVHGLQAYTSQDGGTVIFLQPSDGQTDHGQLIQHVVLEQHVGSVPDQHHEASNGEPGDEHSDPAAPGGSDSGEGGAPGVEGGASGAEPSTPPSSKRDIHPRTPGRLGRGQQQQVVVKRLMGGQGGGSLSRVVKKSTNPDEDDSFDHFGRYLASLLRNLPSRKAAFKLQKEMISWALQEQMRLDM